MKISSNVTAVRWVIIQIHTEHGNNWIVIDPKNRRLAVDSLNDAIEVLRGLELREVKAS